MQYEGPVLGGTFIVASKLFVIAVLALCLLSFGAERAHAAKLDTQIGDTFVYGSTLLAFATTSDKSEKLAALLFRRPDPGKNKDKVGLTFFNDVQQWNEFRALWNKARATKPPKPGATTIKSIDIGDYWDDEDRIMFSVSVDENGTIEFIVQGPNEDLDEPPMVFDLRPEDFKKFDAAVDAMTAYFRK